MEGKQGCQNSKVVLRVIRAITDQFPPLFLINYMNNLNTNEKLTPCQSGFRSLHSTVTALLEATSDWSMNTNHGLINGAVFIDLIRLLIPLTIKFF